MIMKEITARGCVRHYSDKIIPSEAIKEILDAGRLAPSWMNVQSRHFIVVDNPSIKELLSSCSNFQKQIKEASHVIVILGDNGAWEDENFSKILKQRGVSDEGIHCILNDKGYNPHKNSQAVLTARTLEQCTYSVAYMDIQAQHLGIDTCIIGAVGNELTGFKPDIYAEVRKKLNIPEKMFVTGLLTLGYRAVDVTIPPKTRKNFDETVSLNSFGNRFEQ